MRETIDSLLWLSTCTRLDFMMTLNHLARFVSVPTTKQWTAVKLHLRYLNGSLTLTEPVGMAQS
ncbi:Uncharacterized protein PHPALM_8807 [Phytophthora palmivora]|uniref:Uncharacterized protein n=1 Tax=Phytophthora palmivora TaxID=4796 RepID=A0A2P4Y8X5_9STRA|nr:Uncharacterized protein PHPALM_8807 [Phytophthora palmivora]